MTDIPRNRAGVTLGLLFTLCHIIWLGLVLTDLSNRVINVTAQAHFLAFQYGTYTFEPVTALLGIIGAFATGFITGWLFAVIWNLTGNYL